MIDIESYLFFYYVCDFQFVLRQCALKLQVPAWSDIVLDAIEIVVIHVYG